MEVPKQKLPDPQMPSDQEPSPIPALSCDLLPEVPEGSPVNTAKLLLPPPDLPEAEQPSCVGIPHEPAVEEQIDLIVNEVEHSIEQPVVLAVDEPEEVVQQNVDENVVDNSAVPVD